MAQEPLEKTQQSCLLVGEGAKSSLQQDVHLLQRKVMTAGMREGEKNSGQHPVWGKIPPLPAPASLHPEPAKWVTGSSQPAMWGGLTPHSPVGAISIYLYSLLAPGLKPISFLGGVGRGCGKK